MTVTSDFEAVLEAVVEAVLEAVLEGTECTGGTAHAMDATS